MIFLGLLEWLGNLSIWTIESIVSIRIKRLINTLEVSLDTQGPTPCYRHSSPPSCTEILTFGGILIDSGNFDEKHYLSLRSLVDLLKTDFAVELR